MRSPTDVSPRPRRIRASVASVLDWAHHCGRLHRILVAAQPGGPLDRPDVVLPDRLRQSVWTTLLVTKVGLAVVFGLIFFILMWVNLLLTDRFGARDLSFDPEDEIVRRFQNVVRPYAGRIYAVIGVLTGLDRGSQRHRPVAGLPALHPLQVLPPERRRCSTRTSSFYVFTLPFLSFIVTWTARVLVRHPVITAAFHYLNGGIRATRVTPRVCAAGKGPPLGDRRGHRSDEGGGLHHRQVGTRELHERLRARARVIPTCTRACRR